MKLTVFLILGVLNIVALGIGFALAGDVTIPNDFVAGTSAVADEVNENFDAVATEVNDNNTRISTNETNINTNIADISENADDILNNANNIASLPRLGDNLPTGSTIRGFFGLGWTADAAGEFHETYVAFGFTLASAPTAHFIPNGSSPPTGCPGSSTNPQANAGHICFYEDNTGNTTSKSVCSSFNCPGATRWGIQYRAFSVAAGSAWTRGTWAVTAP